MRLHDFIQRNMEQILQAWEDFARSVDTPLPTMDAKGLRNHARGILLTVVKDMRTSQTDAQQVAKSQGQAPRTEADTPAETHAVTRLMAGFSLDQLISEYRALRSSVLRLWLTHESLDNDHHLQDMIRFNEAIDQAMCESVATYGQAVEATRKTVLGVLGHDLRSPLGAVLMAGELIHKSDQLPGRERKLATQICISAERANRMVEDLLDLARCNLGTGIPVNVEASDLQAVCKSVVEELRTAHPGTQVAYVEKESVTGLFDPSRIAQVFSNLISNAIRHGSSKHPIKVSLSTRDGSVIFEVHNHGEVIPSHVVPYLFNPEGRYSSFAANEKGPSSGLGLGLFIAAEIVKGHGGQIDVASDEANGTVFRVALPTGDIH
ncbi:sensor histidine kinase [Pseudomonas sp. M47T1]|uniref:sensor histidine kinase n=1 Tax=Pseudomonas sp. M47T1 TaxID=1179778 RepID=UPI0002608406|nr:HAMP domain-containing sensor histidine kinase [Pseudomonas sp. M47T1]EIK93332.1 sensor histidine kinase [Pseudomonas sp. M47T1]